MPASGVNQKLVCYQLAESVLMPVLGTRMALHPGACAIGVVFFFPDGYGGFDGIDDGAAGGEGGVAVGGRDGDGDGDVTNLKVPGAVLTACGDDVVIFADFLQNSVALFLREGRESLVFQ